MQLPLVNALSPISQDRTEDAVYDVLIVDDDDLVRATLASVMEDEGWTVREARNPAEALGACAGPERCRLLLTDINLGMPQDGFDVAAILRQRFPDLPVVFITGRPWVYENRRFGKRERALSKPLTMSSLAETVRELMQAG
ncbi:response regulator [Roseomonas gilardii subsp. gilardii]|uniref:response regulator n=1 Tax=Roseomonas gilardii TaxID=257708 RepID=UPI001FFC2358|nr:response regulator [Roseomonas gilardii]UPG72142.1 response regulator [Roseomonas gilardii subsp. gilardii]